MQRLHGEYRHLIESFATLVSGPTKFIEHNENCIKDRIREIMHENKDKSAVSCKKLIIHTFRTFFNYHSSNLKRLEKN